MKSNFWFRIRRVALLILVSGVFAASALAAGPRKKTIYNFTGGTDGGLPYAGFSTDASGLLYGTASNGGSEGCSEGGSCGVVFTLKPPQGGGSWTQTSIYAFDNGGGPSSPQTGVVLDGQGNLYGAAQSTLYQLAPVQGGGNWTFNSLYYAGGSYLAEPVVDAAGNVYFTDGNVLELSPGSNGTWTTTTINVGGAGYSSLTMDKVGRLYGVNPNGGQTKCGAIGKAGCGIIFEMIPESGGTWNYRVIYEFSSNSTGSQPLNGLALDAEGNLYGSSELTNAKCVYGTGCAVVFEISPPAVEGEPWTETPLHAFQGGGDGLLLYGTLSVDSKGAVFGTTYEGGSGFCSNVGCGTVFQLKPPAIKGGAWSEILYSFKGGSDGAQPRGSLLIDEKTGTLYSTTLSGGAYNQGTAFEILFP